MNKFNELKYIPRLPLKKLRRFSGGWFCSCPICNEGSSPWKTRMFILTEKKTFITVYCHNCGYDTNLKTFIGQLDPLLHEEYVKEEKQEYLDGLKNGTLVTKEKVQKKEKVNIDNLKYIFNLNSEYFVPAKQSSDAVAFCKKRRIIDFIDDLYYNVHQAHTLTGMVIFPFYTDNKQSLYGFQGRHTSEKRFHTHSKNEGMKIYNYYNVDTSKQVYVFESIIDSMMIDNTTAALGVSIGPEVEERLNDPIYILDNDKKGIDTAIKYASENKKIFIYPKNFGFKDFNEAVCKGFPKTELKQMVNENSYKGFSATVRLNLIKQNRKF